MQEAYHHQGFREYHKHKCYGWKQTCAFCRVDFPIAVAEMPSVATAKPAIVRRIYDEIAVLFQPNEGGKVLRFFDGGTGVRMRVATRSLTNAPRKVPSRATTRAAAQAHVETRRVAQDQRIGFDACSPTTVIHGRTRQRVTSPSRT